MNSWGGLIAGDKKLRRKSEKIRGKEVV